MPDLPVMLRVDGRRCVVIGGGSVALRRARALHRAGAVVVIVAPKISEQLAGIAAEVRLRNYEAGDLDGAFLAVIATDNAIVNQAASDEAVSNGALVNRVDAPGSGDLTIPAHKQHGPITLAVHTGGASAAAAVAIRRQLSASLDPDWPTLLEIVGPYRERILKSDLPPKERRDRLVRMTDQDAMNLLKQDGPTSLRDFCDRLIV